MERVLHTLARDLKERGSLDLSECFVDATLASAKTGLPVSICTSSTSPHEVTLAQQASDARFVDTLPEPLGGDRAYDSDSLEAELVDAELATQGIQIILPHRKNRQKPRIQDRRAPRRFHRGWRIERLFAWLYNFRRVVTR